MTGKCRYGLVSDSLSGQKPVVLFSCYLDAERRVEVHDAALPEHVAWSPTPLTCIAEWTKTTLNHYRISMPTVVVQSWLAMHNTADAYDLAHRLLPRRRVGDIRWQAPLHLVLTVEFFNRR